MRKLGFIITISLFFLGCGAWHNFVVDLNDRKVESCVYYEGNSAGYVRVRGVIATGGLLISDCMEVKELR